MPMFITLALAFLLLVFWCIQFTLLMLMEDRLFPGRHDKALWVAAFLLAALMAPFAFLLWRRASVAKAP
jgi:hypothetical protein